jgi:hypothetical protein
MTSTYAQLVASILRYRSTYADSFSLHYVVTDDQGKPKSVPVAEYSGDEARIDALMEVGEDGGPSYNGLWVIDMCGGCVYLPETHYEDSVISLASFFHMYPPVVYSSAEEAARVTITGQ